MIDWHSHILPAMDDGARTPAESRALLEQLALQGVDTAAATPHFYANRESPAQFLARRRRALDALQQEMGADGPRILPGAEVRYYPGIARLDGLDALRIEGTRVLLLEMPENRWPDSTVQELLRLSGMRRLRIVLAHVERYRALQSPEVWPVLLDSGIRMQVNADYFLSWKTRRRALSALDRGEIHFLGSDCHNLTARPPRLGEARSCIVKRLGADFFAQMDGYGYAMLSV